MVPAPPHVEAEYLQVRRTLPGVRVVAHLGTYYPVLLLRRCQKLRLERSSAMELATWGPGPILEPGNRSSILGTGAARLTNAIRESPECNLNAT